MSEPVSLLPSNATPWMLAVSETSAERFDALMAETDKLATLWDPWACPPAWLPYLARAVQVPVWDEAWPDETKRAVIARTPHWQHFRGTIPTLEEVVAVAGGRVVSVLAPPLSPIAGARASEAEIRAWLGRLPQIRVTTSVDVVPPWGVVAELPYHPLVPAAPAIAVGPYADGAHAGIAGGAVTIAGTAPPGALVEVLVAGPGETIPDVPDPRVPDPDRAGSGWSSPRAMLDGGQFVGGGRERSRRAVLVRGGTETELSIVVDADRLDVETFVLPQPASITCLGAPVGALLVSDGAPMPAASVRRADAADAVRHLSAIALGAAEAVTAAPETEITVQSDPNVGVVDQSAIGWLVGGAVDVTVTEVWRLVDPDAPAPEGMARGTCIGQGRLDWPAHTMELLVEVREAPDPAVGHVGCGLVDEMVAGGPTRTPTLDRIVAGVRAIKAVHDDVDLDTAFPPPQRLADTARLADLRL